MKKPLRAEHREWVDVATDRFREELATTIAAYRGQGKDVRDVLGEPEEFAVRVLHAALSLSSPTLRQE